MSRIGNKEITVPAGVTVNIDEHNLVSVKGPKGSLSQAISKDMIIEQNDGKILVKRPSDNKEHIKNTYKQYDSRCNRRIQQEIGNSRCRI